MRQVCGVVFSFTKNYGENMLSFNPIDADNAPLLKQYLDKTPYGACEYTVASLFMWSKTLNSEVAFHDGCAFMRVAHETGHEYLLPIGRPLYEALDIFCEQMHGKCCEVTFICIPPEYKDMMQARFTNADMNYRRKWSDYIYNADEIKQLAGRKYGGQRNHINRFIKENPNHEVHLVNEGNISRVIDFLKYFTENDTREKPPSFYAEYEAALLVLNNFKHLDMDGIFVTIDGEMVSFAVGEVVHDTLFVHIEKADMNYHGSYPFIVREFARHFAINEVIYINREDDSDDEGLRKSKLSYHPVRMLDKYFCRISTENK